ncbi:hypothetical protein HYT55_01575 [Candidatus Woesearchaeota archaeon]|nr:hypothetical protein [Candidatus Woesearchaeota archaeon]
MSFSEEIMQLLQEHQLSPNVIKDQHFCIDSSVFQTLIHAAHLKREDVILEIGPGPGLLTRKMAKQVKKVIAIELDETLRPLLTDLSKNVDLHFGNALTILPLHKEFNKLISNLPYQICEPLLQYLTTVKHIQLTVLTVPKTFARKAQQHPIFSSFLSIEIIKDVPKEAFYPQPRVLSAIITISPIKNPTDPQFLIQKLHLQRDKKLRNGLRDALIDLYRRRDKILTKKQAVELIQQSHLSEKTLDTLIAKVHLKKYKEFSTVPLP